jgi:PAS domain-containing protein
MSVITIAESSLFNLSSATDGLRLILETALDAVVVMQSDGVVADWNDRAADVFGWSHDEAAGVLQSLCSLGGAHDARHDMRNNGWSI